MHITERLGLNHGRPANAGESELLGAFEQLFIAEDFLFLRWGPTITLTSDFGITILSVSSADRFSANVLLVMVPPPSLSPAQVKNVIAAVSAEEETDQKLLVLERLGQPLVVVSEVELLRPFARDELHRAYRDFAYLTEAAIGRALGSPPSG